MKKPIVKKLIDIENNIKYLDKIKSENFSHQQYKNLIRRGVNFVAYYVGEELSFIPSRFVGYKDNVINPANKGNGGITNNAVDKILGKHARNEVLELKFLLFCKELEIIPDDKSRKYWPSQDRIRINSNSETETTVTPPGGTEGVAIVKTRKGQDKFRKDLLLYWRQRCALTGIQIEAVLKASHIKPWCKSDDMDRLDPNNGILLSANADALFDKGLMTFEDDGTVKFTNSITPAIQKKLLGESLLNLSFDKAHLPNLKYHRDNIFENGIG
ncbi:MAG: HNH endonuclease [Nitratireductor sp.]